MSEEPDVIIIGAGAAGLSAAKELTMLGLRYTLVEASHRMGGGLIAKKSRRGIGLILAAVTSIRAR